MKHQFTYKGTRILYGELATRKRNLINEGISILRAERFGEIMIPIIQFSATFQGKVGKENSNLMYKVVDRGGRDICLAPEYTAVVQKLAQTQFKQQKDIRLFYIAECFRGEKPQRGRFRQFTQLGVEILNPTKDYLPQLSSLAIRLVKLVTDDFEVNTGVTRGLDYYKDGKGFEIEAPSLGAQKQVCGGGSYDSGIGFAIGIDRLLEI